MASLFDAVERPRVIINTNDFDKPKSLSDNIEREPEAIDGIPDHHKNILQSTVDKLFGLHGEERYQLWPERLVRDAVSAPHDVMTEGLLPPGLRREDFTDIPAPSEPTTTVGKALGIAPVGWQPNDNAIEKAQAVSALAGTGGLAGAGNEAGMALGVVPVDVAKKLNFKSSPVSDVLKQAVSNTPSASIDADGHLVLKVLRNQLPDQEMAESVRGGVFYLPEGSKYARYYNGTTNNNYGGMQSIEGETAFKNPLVVRGQTGGKAPENAYTQITGDKKAFKVLNSDVMEIVNASWMKNKDPQAYYDLVNRFLDKHAPEMRGYADHILDNSNKGNQLRYALQEAAIASAARKAGHDGIIGYSEGRGPNKGKPFLSEIFDVRENRYPSPDGDFSVHPSLYADSSKESAALQANRPFYSAVENAVAAAKQPKADAQQWLSFLKNQPGVKQEELAHLGLDKLSGAITKDDLLKAIQEGQPQIKEVVKGGTTNKDDIVPDQTAQNEYKEAWDAYTKELNRISNNGTNLTAMRSNEYRNLQSEMDGIHDLMVRDTIDRMGGLPTPTKYHEYQLPGGENYREMLLTLPPKPRVQAYAIKYKDGPQIGEAYSSKAEAEAALKEMFPNRKDLEIVPEKATNDGVRTGSKPNPDDYRSSHWDEPNVLAHIRMNDRNIDGKKSLHLEEIQSDWHQEGRKKGYKSDDATKEYDKLIEDKHELAQKVVKIENELKAEIGKGYDIRNLSESDRELLTNKLREAKASNLEYQKANKAYTEVADKVDKGNPYMGVPDAPFKKTWDELALKKAITHAVKNGYDSISWTPGEAQAARYDLSKQLKNIRYYPEIKKLVGDDLNGNSVFRQENVEPDKLADFIGKDVAEKLLNKDLNGKYKEVEGLDLKVGGQGMKAFYDKMLVDKMNALTRKYGGKVEKGDLGSKMYGVYDGSGKLLNKYKTKSEAEAFVNEQPRTRELKELSNKTGEPVHVLKITPELREHVLKKGFPLFSAGVPVFSPVDHDPFKKDE